MKKRTTILSCIIISIACHSQSISSSVINVNGGTAKNGYYQFEWSVGEMALVNQMNSTGQLIVTNGFLQPFILFPTTNYNTWQFNDEEIRIFPNPAPRYVEINFFTKQKGRLLFTFFDVLGKKVYEEQITSNGVDLIHRIPVTKLPAGSYLLHIRLDAEPGYISKQGSYKILKLE